MSFYRIKQFYWSIAAKIERDDIEFINLYLNAKEIELFKELSKSEQKHSIEVARKIKEICNGRRINGTELIRVGLFHDIGKSIKRLNVIEKSIIVLLDKFTKSKIKKVKNKKVDIYYNHGPLGAQLLGKYNYGERMLYLIYHHHDYCIKGDEELSILQYCDSIN